MEVEKLENVIHVALVFIENGLKLVRKRFETSLKLFQAVEHVKSLRRKKVVEHGHRMLKRTQSKYISKLCEMIRKPLTKWGA